MERLTEKHAIYAEDLLASLRDDPHINGKNFARVRRHVNEMPGVDAVEVVHGRWEVYGYAGFRACSNCKMIYEWEKMPLARNYCPNCGAKMDGGNEDA